MSRRDKCVLAREKLNVFLNPKYHKKVAVKTNYDTQYASSVIAVYVFTEFFPNRKQRLIFFDEYSKSCFM